MSADLAVLTTDPSAIERAADPGEFIIQACDRAKAWLREALEHGEIEQIAECKSQAEALRVYTMSKQLGQDAQLAATEIVRRAERGIGLAIRRGQANGTVRRRGQGRGYTQQLPKPTDFASHDELMGNGAGIYEMTDEVSDEEFEAALTQAKDEGNLSRANVVRKARRESQAAEWIPDRDDHTTAAAVRRRELIQEMAEQGFSSRQMERRLRTSGDTIRRIARQLGVDIPADQVIRGTRHHDSNHIVQETVNALEGLVIGIELVNPGELDPAQVEDWATSLTDSIRVLNRLIKTMKGIAQ